MPRFRVRQQYPAHVRLGNCTTDDVERVLRSAHPQIIAFANDTTTGVLEFI
jgi:hypothetical protein